MVELVAQVLPFFVVKNVYFLISQFFDVFDMDLLNNKNDDSDQTQSDNEDESKDNAERHE